MQQRHLLVLAARKQMSRLMRRAQGCVHPVWHEQGRIFPEDSKYYAGQNDYLPVFCFEGLITEFGNKLPEPVFFFSGGLYF